MWRILFLPFLFMLMASAPSSPSPDVIEAGRVLATLPDVQAIYFTLMFVIVSLIGLTVYAIWQMGRSQSSAARVASEFSVAADKLAEATKDSDVQIAVQLALIQSNQADVKMALDARYQAEVRAALTARSST